MAMPWFRLWNEFAFDPKIQLLSFEDQRHFVVVLCLKSCGLLDATFRDDEHREAAIASAMRLKSAADLKIRLCNAMLIDAHWQPLNWEFRQPKRDDVNERMQRMRHKRMNNKNVTERKRNELRDSNTGEQIRTEQIRIDKTLDTALPSAQPKKVIGARPRIRIPADFAIDERMKQYALDRLPDMDTAATFRDFRDYHLAKGTVGVDWGAAWRTWVNNCWKGFAYVRRDLEETGVPRLTPAEWRTRQAEKEGQETTGGSGAVYPGMARGKGQDAE